MPRSERDKFQSDQVSIAEIYKQYFDIGTAVSIRGLTNETEPILRMHFNSITCENEMKPAEIHPKENVYRFERADSIVNYAIRTGKKIRGHCLVWHEQVPQWFFEDEGKPASKSLLLKRMKEHITTVVSHYKGLVYCWDVINEAVDDDSTRLYRPTLWYQIAGEEFIEKAFEYAHEADPDALLFYNDYNSERPEKRERIYTLLKNLKEKNVPIHGVGLQGHWSIYEPSKKNLEDAIQRFASLGLIIHITELDISLYPWEKMPRKMFPGENDSLTAELEQRFNEQYLMVFEQFLKYRDVIKSVTFWGISDKYSWLNNYPVLHRRNYPLLFDRQMKPKAVFYQLLELPGRSE
ncbi:MAG: endo-1,4-beta-xylanase [Bacteroidales bacterium]|nr:endo-1,4-beta-xylanase [Bacteroidales bacterium]